MTADDGTVVRLGCSPNFRSNSCLQYNKEWIKEKYKIKFYYFTYDKALYYSNIILRIDKDGKTIRSYPDQIYFVERDRDLSEEGSPYILPGFWTIFYLLWFFMNFERKDSTLYERMKEDSSPEKS